MRRFFSIKNSYIKKTRRCVCLCMEIDSIVKQKWASTSSKAGSHSATVFILRRPIISTISLVCTTITFLLWKFCRLSDLFSPKNENRGYNSVAEWKIADLLVPCSIHGGPSNTVITVTPYTGYFCFDFPAETRIT